MKTDQEAQEEPVKPVEEEKQSFDWAGLVCSWMSLVFGLSGLPVMLIAANYPLAVGAFLSVCSIVMGVAGMGTRHLHVKVTAIVGFVLGVLTLWSVVISWALGHSIASAIESLY